MDARDVPRAAVDACRNNEQDRVAARCSVGGVVVAHVQDGAFDALLPADAESNVTAGLDLPDVVRTDLAGTVRVRVVGGRIAIEGAEGA